MKKTIKEVMELVRALGYEYGTWNGENDSTFETSNAKIKKLAFHGIDSDINITTIKQIAKYASKAFNTLIENGVEIHYQTQKLSIVKVAYNSYKVVVTNKTTNNVELYTLSIKELVNASLQGLNKDSSDVLAQLHLLIK